MNAVPDMGNWASHSSVGIEHRIRSLMTEYCTQRSPRLRLPLAGPLAQAVKVGGSSRNDEEDLIWFSMRTLYILTTDLLDPASVVGRKRSRTECALRDRPAHSAKSPTPTVQPG